MPAPSPTAWLFSPNGGDYGRGMAGWSIYDIQYLMKALATARRQTSFNPGVLTGVWNPSTTAAVQAWLRADGFPEAREFGEMERARLLRACNAAGVTLIGDRWRPTPWSVSQATWDTFVRTHGNLTTAFRARVRANDAASQSAALAILRSPAPTQTAGSSTAVATPPRTPFSADGAGFMASTVTLKRGMCGTAVGGWQAILNFTRNQHRAPVPSATRTFDAAHETATKALQRVVGFTGRDVDGIVGPETRRRVRALIERSGYSFAAVPALTAAPCPTSTAATPSGGSSSAGGGAAASGGDSMGGDAAPAGGPLGGVLDFMGHYGPVLAVGLGVAAFAMLGGGGGGRRR